MSEIKENVDKTVQVKTSDLPVYCPIPEHALWNQHPRVFIRLDEKTSEASCPYCSTKFKLID